ncbi:MAG: L-lactate permease [Limisphaerales bacterium]
MLSLIWQQHYDPFHNAALSAIVAALPVVFLLTTISLLRIRIHVAAIAALALAFLIATIAYGMPVPSASAASLYGAAYGLFPIGWIILNLIFLYQLTVEKGLFTLLRGSLGTIAPDPRIQVILIAFCFGAFFEGAAGFGTPVAITAAILIQLGFSPLQASGLSLIANTAPVAFGALGTPVIALAGVTGIDAKTLSTMIGRQLPIFSLIVPFWVVCAMSGFRGMLQVWPAALTAGVTFAIPQFVISNFHGPWLVDIVASVCSMVSVIVLLKFWRPKTSAQTNDQTLLATDARQLRRAWLPWIVLTVAIFVWGIPQVKNLFHALPGSNPQLPVAALHNIIVRGPEVSVPNAPAEKAIFALDWLAATGTGILFAAVFSGVLMGYRARELWKIYRATVYRVRHSLLTIAAMLALGFLTRYSGTDATLGLALAKTGALYPFFGTLLGWLGVALTGSDTASNVLFGNLQTITAKQTGISPILMAAANSSGGVMGKMVDAQSIVVASTATNWYGQEGKILRFVFIHSLILAALVGLLVFLQAYVAPFTSLVPAP